MAHYQIRRFIYKLWSSANTINYNIYVIHFSKRISYYLNKFMIGIFPYPKKYFIIENIYLG